MSHHWDRKSVRSNSTDRCTWACSVVMAVLAQAEEALALVRAEAAEVMEAVVPAVLAQPGPPAWARSVVSDCLALEELAQAPATDLVASDSANPQRAAEEAEGEALRPGPDRERCRLRRAALFGQRTERWKRRRLGSSHRRFPSSG